MLPWWHMCTSFSKGKRNDRVDYRWRWFIISEHSTVRNFNLAGLICFWYVLRRCPISRKEIHQNAYVKMLLFLFKCQLGNDSYWIVRPFFWRSTLGIVPLSLLFLRDLQINFNINKDNLMLVMIIKGQIFSLSYTLLTKVNTFWSYY